MCLAPDVSLMQGQCDKSTSHVITGPRCITSIKQLFPFSPCMLFVAPPSQELEHAGWIYSLHRASGISLGPQLHSTPALGFPLCLCLASIGFTLPTVFDKALQALEGKVLL